MSLRDYLIEFLLEFYKPIRLFVLLYIITINYYFVEVYETVYTYEESVNIIVDHGFVHPTFVSTYNPQKTGGTCRRRRADQYIDLMV